MLGVSQLLAKFAGRAHPKRIRLNQGSLRNESAGGDDAAGADSRAIQDHASHANQTAVFDCATVKCYRVSDRYPLAHGDTVLLLHTMHNTTVLDIRMRANA